MKRSSKSRYLMTAILMLFILSTLLTACESTEVANIPKNSGKPVLKILSSSENKDFDPNNPNGNGLITEFMKTQDFDVQFVLKGSVDSMTELTTNSAAYDSVWLSNSSDDRYGKPQDYSRIQHRMARY